MTATSSQRLDKWLWFARFSKTRTQASRLVEAGKVRINRVKTLKPAANLKEGDVVTAVIHRQPKVLKVLALGKRRGPAAEAQELYEDITPKELIEKHKPKKKTLPVPIAEAPKRDPGTGRPTKRDRRKMERFKERSADGRSRSRGE